MTMAVDSKQSEAGQNNSQEGWNEIARTQARGCFWSLSKRTPNAYPRGPCGSSPVKGTP